MLDKVLKEMDMEFGTPCDKTPTGRLVGYSRAEEEEFDDEMSAGDDEMTMGDEEDMGGDQKDTLTFDIPFLIRVFELVREEIKDDADLHELVDDLLDLGANGKTLSMDDYSEIDDYEGGDEGDDMGDDMGDDDMGDEMANSGDVDSTGPVDIDQLRRFGQKRRDM